MSKSRGTFIQASTYLNHIDPECLRYYYAAKLNDRIEDLDFNLEDFVQRVNTDIVNKLVNLASRNAGFIAKRFEGKLADKLEDEALLLNLLHNLNKLLLTMKAVNTTKRFVKSWH